MPYGQVEGCHEDLCPPQNNFFGILVNMVEDHSFNIFKKNVTANRLRKNDPIPTVGSGINGTCVQSDQAVGSGPSTIHFTVKSLFFLRMGRYYHTP